MDIKSLKDKILQLAIQGKLVPQDENDEPASILLEKIKAEKEQLIKDKVIKKEKPLPEISEEEKSFDLPKGWEWCRFRDVLDVRDGTHDTPKYVSEGIPLITSKNISGNGIDYSNVKYISLDDHIEISKRSQVDNGDILFAMIGSIGNPVIVKKEIEFSIKNVALFKFYNDTYINNKYLYYYLLFSQDNMKKNAKGAVQSFVSLKYLREYLLPLPPLEEQKRIVAKVDELFRLIDELDNNKQELLDSISNTRNKLLQLAIQGKLVEQCEDDEPASVLLERIKSEKEQLIKDKVIKKEKPLTEISEEEKSFDLPKDWEWCRLGDITQINPRNKVDDEMKVSFVPMALFSDGYNNRHDSEIKIWKDIKSGFTHFAENDIAIAKITPCFENRKSAILTNLENGIGAGTTELYILRSYGKLVLPKFIYDIAISEEFIEGGKSTYTGTAGQQRVKKDFIKNYVIGLPPLEEQKRIVAKVDLIMDYLDKLQKEIESQEVILENILK